MYATRPWYFAVLPISGSCSWPSLYSGCISLEWRWRRRGRVMCPECSSESRAFRTCGQHLYTHHPRGDQRNDHGTDRCGYRLRSRAHRKALLGGGPVRRSLAGGVSLYRRRGPVMRTFLPSYGSRLPPWAPSSRKTSEIQRLVISRAISGIHVNRTPCLHSIPEDVGAQSRAPAVPASGATRSSGGRGPREVRRRLCIGADDHGQVRLLEEYFAPLRRFETPLREHGVERTQQNGGDRGRACVFYPVLTGRHCGEGTNRLAISRPLLPADVAVPPTSSTKSGEDLPSLRRGPDRTA